MTGNCSPVQMLGHDVCEQQDDSPNVQVVPMSCILLMLLCMMLSLPLVLQRLQGEVFLFMDMCGSLLATLRL